MLIFEIERCPRCDIGLIAAFKRIEQEDMHGLWMVIYLAKDFCSSILIGGGMVTAIDIMTMVYLIQDDHITPILP